MPERPYPRLEVFERLHISDGLAINADRWQQAHTYHRQRQNFQYQSLHEPGIVYGLGVSIVPDQPDDRLLHIQPGVAIDILGNPIVVPQVEEFCITSEPDAGQAMLVYLAVNHVDPDDLRRATTAKTVRETFRIVEKLHLDPRDVEICRIDLQSGFAGIHLPENVFAPTANQLDFRGRCQPQLHPQFRVQVGQVTSNHSTDAITQMGLSDLLRSLPALYPALRGQPTVQTYSAQTLGRSALDCQLLYVPYAVLLTLPNPALQKLQTFLTQGAVVLVTIDFAEAELLDLLQISQELHIGLKEAERDPDLFDQTGAQLEAEIAAIATAVTQRLVEIQQELGAIAPQLGLDLSESGELAIDHPLRWQPFTFSQFPTRFDQPIYVRAWGGLVLLVGDLSQSWGRTAQPEVPRDVLRSAQEWGINLLHFAAQRHQWTQAMQPVPSTARSTDSLQQRVQEV
jgi:hypothetical protein